MVENVWWHLAKFNNRINFAKSTFTKDKKVRAQLLGRYAKFILFKFRQAPANVLQPQACSYFYGFPARNSLQVYMSVADAPQGRRRDRLVLKKDFNTSRSTFIHAIRVDDDQKSRNSEAWRCLGDFCRPSDRENLGFLELKRPASIDQHEKHASSKKYVLYREYSQARASHVLFFARKNPISSCDDEAWRLLSLVKKWHHREILEKSHIMVLR